jgi:transposase
MKENHIQLKEKERTQLEALLAKGKLGAKVFKRATALLELDRGKTMTAVAQTLGVSYPTVLKWRDTYLQQGLQCLYDAPRSGRHIEIDGRQLVGSI